MNTIDLIMKHKLWSILKQNDFLDIDSCFLTYIFEHAKTKIIDEIKTESMLEDFLNRLIVNNFEYRHEKKMFNYLQKNITEEKILSIIKKQPDNFLLSQWIKRNTNKKPDFLFIKFIDKNLLEDGTFLYEAIHSRNNAMIDYAIELTASHSYIIIKDHKINLLFYKEIKNELKVKLYSKFSTVVNNNALEYLIHNIKNEDELTSNWIIENNYDFFNNNLKKYLNLVNLPYNGLMENLLNLKPELFLDKEKYMFCEGFFEKILQYKLKDEKINNPIENTCNVMRSWGIKINEMESHLILERNINYENMNYLLENKLFTYNMKELNMEWLFNKVLTSRKKQSHQDTQSIKDTCEKFISFSITIKDTESQNILQNNLTVENADYLLNSNLFTYDLEKLLNSTWKKNIDLGMKIAQKLDKDILWKYIENLTSIDKIHFELAYYNIKFDSRLKEKRLKI